MKRNPEIDRLLEELRRAMPSCGICDPSESCENCEKLAKARKLAREIGELQSIHYRQWMEDLYAEG